MIPNPIRKALSSIQQHGVRHLLMGGQACVCYGAAEFSRDVDIALVADPENLQRLQEALQDLRAEVIAVPPFDPTVLHRGHAVHFRCHAPEVAGVRLDIMAVMRGVSPFPVLWERRTTLELDDGRIDLFSLPDLVASKKTQRDKDWPMIRRLLEADYFRHREAPSSAQTDFWLRELRTPELLREVVRSHPEVAAALEPARPLLRLALEHDLEKLERALIAEQEEERARDREYWRPLRAELEQLRRR